MAEVHRLWPPAKARSGKAIDMFKALLERRRTYWADWQATPGSMLLQHLLLPFVLVWIVVNRLVVWTAQTVVWPPEVKAALGPNITQAELAIDSACKLRITPSARPNPAPDGDGSSRE